MSHLFLLLELSGAAVGAVLLLAAGVEPAVLGSASLALFLGGLLFLRLFLFPLLLPVCAFSSTIIVN